jgi:hypothetical protein
MTIIYNILTMIISSKLYGAGSKSEAARAINSNDFSYGKMVMLH